MESPAASLFVVFWAGVLSFLVVAGLITDQISALSIALIQRTGSAGI